MTRYLLQRVAFLLPQLLLISVVTFLLIRLLPGDPARLQLGPFASQEGVDTLRQEMRLDEPTPTQYATYLERIAQGDFGRSWVNSSDVGADLVERVPATLELMALGMLVVAVVLVPLGVVAASREGGRLGRLARKGTFGYGLAAGSTPDFWLGLILLYLFFTVFGVLPGPEGRLAIGEAPPDRITGMYTVDSLLHGDLQTFASAATHLLLPVVTLAFVYGAPIFKMTVAATSDAVQSDYT
ncbi:MAG: ABC transporter permease, partial [Candidatus Rokuibacteriota bacterium]